MSLAKKLIIVFIFTLFCAAIIFISLSLSNNISSKNEMISYKLGYISKKGTVGVDLTYDVSPPDVILQAPSGTMFTEKSAKSYKHDPETKTISIISNKEEIGTWSVSFNKKDNLNISYQMTIYPSSSLEIIETDIIKLEDTYYLGFSTNSEAGILYHPSLTLQANSSRYELIISENLKDLTTTANNDMIYLPLVIPKEVYENNPTSGTLQLTLTTDETKETTKASVKIKFIENEVSMTDIIKNQ